MKQGIKKNFATAIITIAVFISHLNKAQAANMGRFTLVESNTTSIGDPVPNPMTLIGSFEYIDIPDNELHKVTSLKFEMPSGVLIDIFFDGFQWKPRNPEIDKPQTRWNVFDPNTMIFWDSENMLFDKPTLDGFIGIGPDGQLRGRNRLELRDTGEFVVTTRQRLPGSVAVGTYTAKAVPVPEPASTISLLALGTLGAASTLKRKLKSSKSTEKELEKAS